MIVVQTRHRQLYSCTGTHVNRLQRGTQNLCNARQIPRTVVRVRSNDLHRFIVDAARRGYIPFRAMQLSSSIAQVAAVDIK
jgi:hypothetical protein